MCLSRESFSASQGLRMVRSILMLGSGVTRASGVSSTRMSRRDPPTTGLSSPPCRSADFRRVAVILLAGASITRRDSIVVKQQTPCFSRGCYFDARMALSFSKQQIRLTIGVDLGRSVGRLLACSFSSALTAVLPMFFRAFLPFLLPLISETGDY